MASLLVRVVALLAVVVVAGLGATALLDSGGSPRLTPGSGSSDGERIDPLAYSPAREDELIAAATAGNAHVIYAKSPGGARASAERVARYRPLIESAAAAAKLDPDILEAIVLLESAGRPDAAADPRLDGAVGLTQILAETGRSLLGMLAVVSYHMGIGNLQTALRAYGDDNASYARLYFDSTPTRHPEAWRSLAKLGDDSSTYLWRVLAAREIMRLYRSDPAQLDAISALQNRKNSAEEVLHPQSATKQFRTPDDLRAAYDDGRIVALPRPLLAEHGIRIDRQMGELAGRLKRSPATYRGLRPEALALLVVLGAGVREISGTAPLILTSTVRDQRYQRLLLASGNGEATHNFSLHTTGWAFDILRSYRSRAQALAFEFLLGRLQSEDLIAWVREPAAIHVTVSASATSLLGVLRGGG